MQVLPVFADFEVFGDLGILSAEVLKLSVGHGRIESAIAQFCEHVPPGNLALVLSCFWLKRLRNFLYLLVHGGPLL